MSLDYEYSSLHNIIDVISESGYDKEYYKLAIGIRRNEIEQERNNLFKEAFVLGMELTPGALEKIAMELEVIGKNISALYEVAQSVEDFGQKFENSKIN